MIIDFERHLFPDDLARHYRPDAPRSLRDPTRHLQEMTAAGVDVAVLMCPLGWEAEPAICRLVNDRMAAIAQEHPKRLAPLAHIPLGESAVQLAELRHAIEDLGMKGAALTAPAGGMMLDDDRLFPLYEYLSANGRPLYVHPGTQATMGIPFCDDRQLTTAIGWEMMLLTAFTRFLGRGVLTRFPNLKVVFAHMAGGAPSLLDRITHRLSLDPAAPHHPNIFIALSGSNGGKRSLQSAFAGFLPEQLVFASDYPYDCKEPTALRSFIGQVAAAAPDPAQRDRILGETASQMLFAQEV